MDIFNMNFTGNLTGDAVKSEFSDKKIKVYNFTIACNVNEKNTLFLDVAYWAKMKEGAEEDKLLPILVKGKGLTVFQHTRLWKLPKVKRTINSIKIFRLLHRA